MEKNAGLEIYEEMKELMETAIKNGDVYYEKGIAAAGMRARVAFDKIAKLKVAWRKATK
jgi:hypothetical protein